MSVIMIDGVKDIVFHNGIVRIDCLSAGPNGEHRPSGTMIIPANILGTILQSLGNAMQELDKKMKDYNEREAMKGKPLN